MATNVAIVGAAVTIAVVVAVAAALTHLTAGKAAPELTAVIIAAAALIAEVKFRSRDILVTALEACASFQYTRDVYQVARLRFNGETSARLTTTSL